MEAALKDLLNLLDDAFGGINFTEEIQKFEGKYSPKAGFQIPVHNTELFLWIKYSNGIKRRVATDLKTLFSSQRERSKSKI